MKKIIIITLFLLLQPSLIFSGDPELAKSDSEWATFFMPGAVAHLYIPDNHENIGYFQGLSIEYLLAAWIHKNDNHGPSHGRIYTKVNFMKSSKKGIHDIFYLSLGLDLSIERNPQRNYLIPYFGFEFGNMNQKDFGNVIAITPTFGVHIYSSQSLFINLTGGFVYTSKDIENLRGYTLQLGVNFSLW